MVVIVIAGVLFMGAGAGSQPGDGPVEGALAGTVTLTFLA
jgi:hypothetical protein